VQDEVQLVCAQAFSLEPTKRVHAFPPAHVCETPCVARLCFLPCAPCPLVVLTWEAGL